MYMKTLAVFKDYYQYEQGADEKTMEKIPGQLSEKQLQML